jgi:hypothetical protein
MNNIYQDMDSNDKALWEIAQKRASFKSHLFTYMVVNGGLWLLWYFGNGYERNGFPWPVFPMVGWGIGLAFHYVGAYVFPKQNSVQQEFEKLKKQQQKF